MSLHILDTDVLTLYQAGHPTVLQRAAQHPARDLAVTVISVEEQLSGWYTLLRRVKQRDQLARVYARLARTVQFFAGWQILPFPEPAILAFEQLKASKLNVASKDLRIAAITLECGGTLVTRNLKDFQRVPGLAVEDWTV